MKDKVCLITGATAGIGKETALELARQGAILVLACRNLNKGEAVLQEIREKTGNKQIEVLHCDLASLESVRRFVAEFQKKYKQLHILINNAGLVCVKREQTVDGFESAFGINHLGPFLLTHLLLDLIKKSAPARIVNVSSRAHYRGKINFDDLQAESNYNGLYVYSNSKLANVLFTYELARRLQGENVTVNCLHPGVIATDIWPSNKWYFVLFFSIIKRFMISSKEGAQTTLYLATSSEVENVTGTYFDKKAKKESSQLSHDVQLQEKLWNVSMQLCGL